MYAPYYGLRKSSGSLAMFAAIRLASSLLSSLGRRPPTRLFFKIDEPLSIISNSSIQPTREADLLWPLRQDQTATIENDEFPPEAMFGDNN
jgi:hypothetical protein